MALNVADKLEEERILSGIEKNGKARGKYHHPRKKRKRKRRKITTTVPREEFVDPEELPPRARWTIVATACLLLAMSLLLVGVTLRMAPIIDDMGKSKKYNWIFRSNFQKVWRVSGNFRDWSSRDRHLHYQGVPYIIVQIGSEFFCDIEQGNCFKLRLDLNHINRKGILDCEDNTSP